MRMNKIELNTSETVFSSTKWAESMTSKIEPLPAFVEKYKRQAQKKYRTLFANTVESTITKNMQHLAIGSVGLKGDISQISKCLITR